MACSYVDGTASLPHFAVLLNSASVRVNPKLSSQFMTAIFDVEKFLHDKVFIENTVSPGGAIKLPCRLEPVRNHSTCTPKGFGLMTVQFLTEEGLSEHAAASFRFLI